LELSLAYSAKTLATHAYLSSAEITSQLAMAHKVVNLTLILVLFVIYCVTVFFNIGNGAGFRKN